MKPIDEKFALDIRDNEPVIVKMSSGELVPSEGEPLIFFRGRDRLALPMLEHYRALNVLDGCNDFQLASIDKMIDRFREYASDPKRMKQPGITRGAKWEQPT